MDSDQVANLLADGQVLEPLGKHHQSAVLDVPALVDLAGGVGDLNGGDVAVGLEALVREGGIQHHAVEVDSLFAHFGVIESSVLVRLQAVVSFSECAYGFVLCFHFDL